MVHLEAHALVKMKIYLILFLPLLGKFNYLLLSILFVYFYGAYEEYFCVKRGRDRECQFIIRGSKLLSGVSLYPVIKCLFCCRGSMRVWLLAPSCLLPSPY